MSYWTCICAQSTHHTPTVTHNLKAHMDLHTCTHTVIHNYTCTHGHALMHPQSYTPHVHTFWMPHVPTHLHTTSHNTWTCTPALTPTQLHATSHAHMDMYTCTHTVTHNIT